MYFRFIDQKLPCLGSTASNDLFQSELFSKITSIGPIQFYVMPVAFFDRSLLLPISLKP